MQCIFFEKKDESCRANCGTSNYKPDETDKGKFCNIDSFENCPRLKVFLANKSANKTSLKVETEES